MTSLLLQKLKAQARATQLLTLKTLISLVSYNWEKQLRLEIIIAKKRKLKDPCLQRLFKFFF